MMEAIDFDYGCHPSRLLGPGAAISSNGFPFLRAVDSTSEEE
jgi:hypothetical protein